MNTAYGRIMPSATAGCQVNIKRTVIRLSLDPVYAALPWQMFNTLSLDVSRDAWVFCN